MGRGLRDWKGTAGHRTARDQITPDLQARTVEVSGACPGEAEPQQALIRISRCRSLVGLVYCHRGRCRFTADLLVVVLNTVLASATTRSKTVVAGIVTIFIWATVWNPWDRLVYEWVQPWLENRILRSMIRWRSL